VVSHKPPGAPTKNLTLDAPAFDIAGERRTIIGLPTVSEGVLRDRAPGGLTPPKLLSLEPVP
jgi:hypothetical protein